MLIPFNQLTTKYNFKPKGVLHIGASEGQEAEAYEQLGVERVVWIEALPDVFKKLVQNIGYRSPNTPTVHEALNICVSNKSEQVTFNVANNGGQSSSLLEFGTHSEVHPEVKFTHSIFMQSQRLDEVDFDFSGLDFLNIDLQGAELIALEGMGSLLDQFEYAYLEVNWYELYKGCHLVGDLDVFMVDRGFYLMETKECGNTGWGDGFWMR